MSRAHRKAVPRKHLMFFDVSPEQMVGMCRESNVDGVNREAVSSGNYVVRQSDYAVMPDEQESYPLPLPLPAE